MPTDKALSWFYCEESVAEDDVIAEARERAEELGTQAVSPAAGALLGLLARAGHAGAVVEVGTGTGVAALHLLRGMPDTGLLTTIDVEVEHQRAAKEAFTEAGVPTRVRAIRGRAQDVLPRLTDGAYDMVVVDADPDNHPVYAEHAIRLLRSGGTLAVNHALCDDQVADPARRDEPTVTARDLHRALRADDRLDVVMLGVGDGLLLAVRR
ncbi:MAG: class I SAM-dependent methyltransferase [Micrococcales bacterium]|nr:class I SAM-dependent methyltransferase [Micrococcales bacterium]MCL2666194.1 class I SAM-dependent methyltransferase [Micrococcales bacterium]